jgi:hypothetical protein
MAENKKSFILYVDLIHTVKHLTDEQAGKLFKHILSYCNDENPASDDVITNLAFEPVKQALKRDLKKYENYIEKQKANGKKGGRPKAKEPNPLFENPSKAKKADSVSVSVSDNVNVINNNIAAWIKEISNSPEYLNGIYMKLKLRKGTVSALLKEFEAHLKMYESDSKNVSEFKRHFSNWLKLENDKGRLAKYQKETKGQL